MYTTNNDHTCASDLNRDSTTHCASDPTGGSVCTYCHIKIEIGLGRYTHVDGQVHEDCLPLIIEAEQAQANREQLQATQHRLDEIQQA